MPDFVYTDAVSHTLGFKPTVTTTTAVIDTEEGTHEYHFGEWSRHQFLAHLGAKEKWFRHVTTADQAEELNRRTPALYGQVFRLLKDDTDPDIRVIRGMVSDQYADIADLDIMNTLLEIMPDGYAVRSVSEQTQRALYVFAVRDEPFSIPNTKFRGYPGVVIRNSEVGFTSLWVVPTIWTTRRFPLVFNRQPLLKRVHRGNVDLSALLLGALDQAKSAWGPLKTKIRALGNIRYPDQDTALAAIEGLVLRAGGQKWMSKAAREAYARANNAQHSGESILNAVVVVLENAADTDAGYDLAAVAGGVLIALTS